MSILKKVLRAAVYLVAGLFSLVILLYVVLFAANVGDEEPSAESLRLIQLRKPELAPGKNAYFRIAAFNAPESADAQAVGEAYVAALAKVFEAHPNGTPSIAVYEAAPLPPVIEVLPTALRCSPDKESCLDKYLRDREAYRKRALEQAFLLKRYAAIRATPGFEEPFIPDVNAPFPSFTPLRGAREIELALLAASVAEGEADSGLAKLADINAHDRLIVQQSRTLLGRVLGARMVFESALLASQLLHRVPALADSHAPILGRILAPLDPASLDMSAAFDSEAGMMMRLFSNVGRGGGGESANFWGGNQILKDAADPRGNRILKALASPLYRRQDTMNTYARLAMDQRAIASAKANGVEASIAAADRSLKAFTDAVSPTEIAMIRNPVGKILIYTAQPDLWQFKRRLVDLDGYLRMMGLQLALTAAKVPASEAAAWMRQNATGAVSPYDGSPFTVDTARKELRFSGKGRHNFIPGDNKTLLLPLPL